MDPFSDPANARDAGQVFGYLSNGRSQRYLLEAESTTGFVAWKTADDTILVSEASQVSLAASDSITFWPCAGYQDTTPAGRIVSFDCHGNALTEVDVHGLTGLEFLDCSFNQLRGLPLDGLTELEALNLDSNRLTSLDVTRLPALRVLNCAGNQLRKLDLSGLASLQILDYSNNRITKPSLKGCTSLKDIKLDGNPLQQRTRRR